jgi:hypothetical protein
MTQPKLERFVALAQQKGARVAGDAGPLEIDLQRSFERERELSIANLSYSVSTN